jgi:hypothetical protein
MIERRRTMEEKLRIPVKSPDECGAYPFGVCIPAAKSRTFEVYKPLLMQWIKERSEG